jgi:polar amino acid transport system substrate-binding protein
VLDARLRPLLAALAALSLLLAACGDDASDDADAAATTTAGGSGDVTTTAGGSDDVTTTAGGSDDATTTAGAGAAAACAVDDLPLKDQGTLTVATGEPVFPPWMIDDDPTNGQGFESALVYALAEEMGFTTENVVWVRTGFDESVAPGTKDYDFNIQQFGITPERDEVVDFSDGYYTVQQALVAAADSEVAGATSLADLRTAQLGAAIGTTSLDYIENVIQPDDEAAVYDDNAAAKAGFDAGQVEGLVFDLPTAHFIADVEIPDADVVGVLPLAGGEPEELGMLFEDGSALVDCVNQALAALRDAGTVEALQQEWLQAGGSIPTLSE